MGKLEVLSDDVTLALGVTDGEVVTLEAEEEAPIVKSLPTPESLTKREYEVNRKNGHIPYRTWCDHCVEGRSREFGQRHDSRMVKSVSTVALTTSS